MARKYKLRLSNNYVNEDKELQVLIGACDEVQHSIKFSLKYTNSKALATDPSLSSLASAKRKP